MGTKLAYGRGKDSVIMNSTISGTTPIVSTIAGIMDIDDIGLQLIVEYPRREFPAKAAVDSVVAASHTWVFTNGNFTAADVGATITVAGAVNSNNNATVTIASVTNATTIVTGGTQTNETFAAGVTVLLIPSVATGAGSWKIEISNDFEEAGAAGLGQAGNANLAHWTDVTAGFSPTILVPDGSTAAKMNQAVAGAPFPYRKFRVTFTPTSGAGNAMVIYAGKSQS